MAVFAKNDCSCGSIGAGAAPRAIHSPMRTGGSNSLSAELTVEPAGQPMVEPAGAVRRSCPGACNARTACHLSIGFGGVTRVWIKDCAINPEFCRGLSPPPHLSAAQSKERPARLCDGDGSAGRPRAPSRAPQTLGRGAQRTRLRRGRPAIFPLGGKLRGGPLLRLL
jgi:hypothetical protein